MRRTNSMHYKDSALARLSETSNVAQFVSFGPDERQRYACVLGYPPDHCFPTLTSAAEILLAAAGDHSVNVRSFTPDNPKSREFIYGLKSLDDVTTAVRRLAGQGLYTIVNETIDIHDHGVSGVAFGGILEFSPEDTPRAVEKPGTLAIMQPIGLRLLETVYGFRPALDYPPDLRVEFSIHPMRCGVRQEHTLIWESEEVTGISFAADLSWPNRFSRMIGDKAFGLLVAHLMGIPVPLTTVLSRVLPPFTFGEVTGTQEYWIRTCPVEQVPGRFTTQRGWCDPFKLMHEEDPEGAMIASVLAQEGVTAAYSGALVTEAGGAAIIEGVQGFGDGFMQGQATEHLPEAVKANVLDLYNRIEERLGPSRIEWVYDGRQVWVVQMHRGGTLSSGRTIFPGEASKFHHFDVSQGLEALRRLITKAKKGEEGVILVGDVGVTSHFGDLLRRAKITSHIQPTSK